MKKFLCLSLLFILLLTGCNEEVNPYSIYEPFCVFEPYYTSSGAETANASVTLLRRDAKIPSQCFINGLVYDVVIFNGFANPEDTNALETIEIPSFITAISSHAFEGASKITEAVIDENVSSLGKACLPKNLKDLIVPAEAICSYQTANLYNALSSPNTLEHLTVTGSTFSTVSLKEFGTQESNLQSITVKGYGAKWPQMPYIKKEGMNFLGWYTKDPLVYTDAEKAVAGNKPSQYSVTVYPYWEEGEDTGEEEDFTPQPIGPVNFYRVYSFGINREYIHVEFNEETEEYTISLDETHWFWEWSYNGMPVEKGNSSSYTFKRSNTGKTQVICFQCDSEGNPSGGALMVEV